MITSSFIVISDTAKVILATNSHWSHFKSDLIHFKNDLVHRRRHNHLKVIAATTKWSWPLKKVITATLNVVSSTTKVIVATEEVTTTTFKVILATTYVILATEDVITCSLIFISATTKVILATKKLCQPMKLLLINYKRYPDHGRSDHSHYKSDHTQMRSDHILLNNYLSHYRSGLDHLTNWCWPLKPL